MYYKVRIRINANLSRVQFTLYNDSLLWYALDLKMYHWHPLIEKKKSANIFRSLYKGICSRQISIVEKQSCFLQVQNTSIKIMLDIQCRYPPNIIRTASSSEVKCLWLKEPWTLRTGYEKENMIFITAIIKCM